MCPEFLQVGKRLQRKESGFSLVAAIFLLVIITALGVFMLSVYTTQRATVNQDILGVRAYHAAKAGLEWASFQLLNPENTFPVSAPAACAAATGTPVFGGALTGYVVNVNCTLTTTTEGSNTIRVYQITSTAVFPAVLAVGATPPIDYVERRLFASVSTCRIGPGTDALC